MLLDDSVKANYYVLLQLICQRDGLFATIAEVDLHIQERQQPGIVSKRAYVNTRPAARTTMSAELRSWRQLRCGGDYLLPIIKEEVLDEEVFTHDA